MPNITVKFLAGIREDIGKSEVHIALGKKARLKDLDRKLRELGIDPDSKETIIILDGRGLRQWPGDRILKDGDEVVVFPSISGG